MLVEKMREQPLTIKNRIPAVFQACCDIIGVRIHLERFRALAVTKPNQIHKTQQQTAQFGELRI